MSSFYNKCLRKILGIRHDELKTNHKIREIAQQRYVSKVIRKKRSKYCVHVLNPMAREDPK